MKAKIFLFGLFCYLLCSTVLHGQDTLKISLNQFIQAGIENSGQVAYERQKVALADNEIKKTRSNRFFPKLELNTQHGLVPGVKSDRQDLDRNELYLDPDLENDFEDLAIFTRAEVDAVQPIFTWGALNNAMNAAESAAEAARERFESQKADIEIRLFELYHSYILTLEVNRLLEEAREQISKVDRQIEERRESGDADIDESDVFKFKIFKSEFDIRQEEIRQNSEFIRRIWDYVLQADKNEVYEPQERFLDPVKNPIEELDFYRVRALETRPEMKAIDAGIDAAEYGLKARRAQSYPSLFLGLTGSVAHTPNRPRQSNPFIINNTNFARGTFGVGLRQNLNFLSVNADISKSKIQHKQAKYLKEAAADGIVLEINERYKDASISKVKIDKTDEALVTGKKWLRQEQLDYDFGLGEIKDLLDALQKELELRVQLKRRIFEFNKDMAELYRASGMEVTTLKMKN